MIIYVSVDDNGVYKPANIAGGVPPCVQALPVVVANSSSSAAVRRCRSRGLKEPRSLLPWGTHGQGTVIFTGKKYIKTWRLICQTWGFD